ncbi:MAG: formyltransferase family protein [Chloroflexi bacterium]|nr:formyltransferase family protein [Chloroflexota bacterium]
MLTMGWFSTGRGEGSLGLLQKVQEAIERGQLSAKIQFVFSNREPGEAEGSDHFFQQVNDYGIPLVTLSSQHFRRERGGGPFSRHRLDFDREVMKRLEGYEPDVCVFAGYGLITDVEMCNRYTMLNLHPALPGGPVGTWQQVIWKLIEDRAKESGVYIHLATEDLDMGPVLTYCSFPLTGEAFDPLWSEIEGRSVEDMKAAEGEELPLFQLIRKEGIKRERPLLLETLKALANGDIRVEGRRPLDASGNPTGGPSLNEAIERALEEGG